MDIYHNENADEGYFDAEDETLSFIPLKSSSNSNHKMHLEHYRRQTFYNNSSLPPQTIVKLANAGFCNVDLTHNIRCFMCYCEISLDKETNTDSLFEDPLTFHSNLNPNCIFVQRYRAPNTRVKKNYSMISLFYEQERIESFIEWPIPWLNPNKLAQKGFYYTRVSDYVVCVFCNTKVGNWTPMDSIDSTNIKHECQGNNMSSSSHLFNVTTEISDILKKCSSDGKIYPIPNMIEFSKNGIYPLVPHHVNFVLYSDRYFSFSSTHTFPLKQSIPQIDMELAKAGFYYTGFSDIVICHHCSGSLKNLEIDDNPWELHAKYYPYCSYVLMYYPYESFPQTNTNLNACNVSSLTNKDLDKIIEKTCYLHKYRKGFIRNALKRQIDIYGTPFIRETDLNRPVLFDNNNIRNESNDEDVIMKDYSVKKYVENDVYSQNVDMLCKICKNSIKNVILYPCTHLVMCKECLKELYGISYIMNCPYCRQKCTAFSLVNY